MWLTKVIFFILPFNKAMWVAQKIFWPTYNYIEHKQYRLSRHLSALWLSLKHRKWVVICAECNGEGRYYNSYDTRDCTTCHTKGYSKRHNFKDV